MRPSHSYIRIDRLAVYNKNLCPYWYRLLNQTLNELISYNQKQAFALYRLPPQTYYNIDFF